MKKGCKHRWRVGSNNAMLYKGKLITTSLNIWCEKCDKHLRAYSNWRKDDPPKGVNNQEMTTRNGGKK